MKSPYDFANDINKLKLELDYAKYHDDTKDEKYENNNDYDDVEAMKAPSKPDIQTSFDIGGDITKGLTSIKQSNIAPIATTESTDSKGAFGTINGKGQGVENSAGQIAQFGISQLGMFQNQAQSEAEGWSGLASSTLSGASTGMMVGGPIGAAIGGAAGLITGGVDMIIDGKKRNEKAREDYDNNLSEATKSRLLDWETENGQKEINKLNTLRKSQLNYIDLDY